MRRLRTALVLLLLVVAAAGLTTPAAAQERESPTGQVTLVGHQASVPAGGTFDLRVAFDDLRLAERLQLAVTVHGRLGSRSAFARTLTGEGLRGTTSRHTSPVGELPRDPAGNPFVTVQAGGLREGVYPVTVALRSTAGEVVDSFVTHLVRIDADAATAPLAVAWILPVGIDPLRGPDGPRPATAEERAELTTAITAAGAGLPLTLDVTPESLAAVNDQDLATLRRAVAGGNQLLANPFVDVDPSALAAAGIGDDLAIQRQAGEELLQSTLGDRGDPRTWSARPLGAPGLERLRALGVTRVAVPESSLAGLGPAVLDGKSLTRPFRLGGAATVEAVAVDTQLSAHFSRDDDPVLAAHQLLADLAVLYLDAPGARRGVVVRPPADWRPDAEFLDVALGDLRSSGVLRPVTLDQLFDEVAPLEDDGDPVVRTLTGGRSGELPAARFGAAKSAHRRVTALAPQAGLVEDMRLRLLVAESADLTGAERHALLDSLPADLDLLRGRLHLPPARTYRLTAREGTVPVSLTNDNPFPVRVQLELTSDKLEFPGGETGRGRRVLQVELGARDTYTEPIPVRARASATFLLRATVLSPDGDELLRRDFKIVSTVFSGVGVVLSIGAGLFLLLWWGRHWRTVRRDRRLVDPPA